ncbi:MAG: hypothetical protein WA988_12040 [Candidatus Nanopelagicales bacterium]
MTADHQRLLDTALASLRANLVDTDSGQMLTAGWSQFRTLWTRDFCFSVPGLLAAGHEDVVNRQLRMLFATQRDDGLIVRGLDVIDPKRRVLLNTALRPLPRRLRTPDYRGRPLLTEYLGEHGTPAIDSNVLVVQAIGQYVEHTGDTSLIEDNRGQIDAAMAYYSDQFTDGLVSQPGFSDWQDSASREGPGLYLHVLLLRAAELLRRNGIDTEWKAALAETISATFYSHRVGLFAQDTARTQFPLEANLWIIESGLFTDTVQTADLYENLKQSPLWRRIGVPITPNYLNSAVSWTTKIVGLRHYHDQLRWSWLMAEAARIAKLMGDQKEAEKIYVRLRQLTAITGEVAEVYEATKDAPVKRGFYRSESPFSWGAAKIVESLGT